MGIEYSLRFSAPDADAVAALLRSLPGATASSPVGGGPPGHQFDLGADPAGQDWPAATVQVEPDGAYFCSYGGEPGRAYLGEVVAALVSYFGPVTVEEL